MIGNYQCIVLDSWWNVTMSSYLMRWCMEKTLNLWETVGRLSCDKWSVVGGCGHWSVGRQNTDCWTPSPSRSSPLCYTTGHCHNTSTKSWGLRRGRGLGWWPSLSLWSSTHRDIIKSCPAGSQHSQPAASTSRHQSGADTHIAHTSHTPLTNIAVLCNWLNSSFQTELHSLINF